MKKIIAWLLVLAMTAAISIGATLAYLTDTDEDVNVMTLGNVKIDQLEYERIDDETTNEDATVQEFHDNKPLYPAVTDKDFNYVPGDTYVDWEQIGKDDYTSDIWDPDKINNELDKMVFVKNKGDYDAYVRTMFAFEAGSYTTLDQFKQMVHLNLNETDYTWEWVKTPVAIPNAEGSTTNYFVATATYDKILAPGALTEISLSQIALDKTATNADVEAFGETYQILVKTQAIQSQGFENPADALDEGFGEVDAISIPWENDAPTVGATIANALHYLGADITTSAITGNVSSVTFGLNKDYAEIAGKYDGTLVDVEQDVPVYAYYVPNGSNYDIYFLADDAIYAPKDCGKLFLDMKAMKTLNTENLSFSRTETMRNMLRECQSLTSLDVSGWDLSNTKDISFLFQNCNKLQEIKGIENWDTSKVAEMKKTFYKCSALPTVNVTAWDVSNVTTMECLFSTCGKLTTVDLTGWDTSKVTNIHDLFVNCTSLTTVEGLGTWDTSSVTDMISAFNGCTALVDPGEIGNWDTSNVESIRFMFYNCKSLKELDIGSWDTAKVTEMNSTFKGCKELTTLDLSNWDTGNVTTFSSMFSSYGSNTPDMKIKTIGLENWDTGNCELFQYMFYGCGQLEEIDMSKWDTSSVTTTYHMFADCNNLKTINFSGWNTPNLTNMDGMFNDCRSLVTVDVSDIDTQNVEDMSQIFESCKSLKEVKGLENWDTSKVWDFDQFFLNCSSIEVIDISCFDTSSAEQTGTMFQSCTSLTTIYVGDGWDMSKVTASGSMFHNCPKLVGANGTTTKGNPTDGTYARVDTPAVVDAEGNVLTEAVPGYLTYKSVENP